MWNKIKEFEYLCMQGIIYAKLVVTPLTTAASVSFFIHFIQVYLVLEHLYDHIKQGTFQTRTLNSNILATGASQTSAETVLGLWRMLVKWMWHLVLLLPEPMARQNKTKKYMLTTTRNSRNDSTHIPSKTCVDKWVWVRYSGLCL